MSGNYKNNVQREKISLHTLSDEKLSGGAYSLLSVVPTLLSFFVLVVLASVNAVPSEEEPTPDWFLYLNYAITYLSFLIVGAVYFFVGKRPLAPIKNKCHPKYFLLAILLQIGLFSLSALNGLFLDFLGKFFGYKETPISLPSLSGAGFYGVLFTVALLPAFFEELLFRGILLDGVKKYGEIFAVLVCGALFSLYHKTPEQTMYQFVCGAAFALIAVRSGSIWPTVVSHFINNALIICLAKAGYGEALPKAWETPVLIVSILCLLLAVVWITFESIQKRKNSGTKTDESEGERGGKKDFFLYAAIGIVICAASWLGSFFS